MFEPLHSNLNDRCGLHAAGRAAAGAKCGTQRSLESGRVAVTLRNPDQRRIGKACRRNPVPLVRVLKRDKEEQLVFFHGAAEGAAILILVQHLPPVIRARPRWAG